MYRRPVPMSIESSGDHIQGSCALDVRRMAAGQLDGHPIATGADDDRLRSPPALAHRGTMTILVPSLDHALT